MSTPLFRVLPAPPAARPFAATKPCCPTCGQTLPRPEGPAYWRPRNRYGMQVIDTAGALLGGVVTQRDEVDALWGLSPKVHPARRERCADMATAIALVQQWAAESGYSLGTPPPDA